MKEADDRSRRRFLKTGSILGLAAALSPRTIAEAFTNSDSKTNQKEDFMTQTSAAQLANEQAADKAAIRTHARPHTIAGTRSHSRVGQAARGEPSVASHPSRLR